MKTLSCTLPVLSLLLLVPGLHAANISSCAPDFSSCNVFEDGAVLNLTGVAIAGDVIITEPWNSAVVSDVFRIFNDFADTGGGTGLGVSAFLYSMDLNNLPAPSTFSVNAVFVTEGPSIGGGLTRTDYNGNRTLFSIFSSDAVPEPSTFALLALGGATLAWRRRLLLRALKNGGHPEDGIRRSVRRKNCFPANHSREKPLPAFL
jgi:hypothetical protein